VILIKAWLPSSQDEIIRTCIKSIAAGLSRFYPFSDFIQPLRRYAAQIVKLAPDPFSKVSEWFVMPSQEEQIETLRNRLATLDRRLVVLLDEVDRMEREELVALLKFVRGTDLFPNLSFSTSLQLLRSWATIAQAQTT
jgi:Cdc6-like AAA superfamily ATPase